MEFEKKTELKNAESELLAKETVKVLLEKKAHDVKLFYVKETTSITDYYVNATGRSSTQVASLADELAFKTEECGRVPLRVEGREGKAWLLVDYGDVIVHLFNDETRLFYHLESLWGTDENTVKY